MSITLMAEVWPLDMPHTDKLVLLALADSANDEDDGKTWLPIVSKIPLTRSARVKLSLVVKTRLGETAIRSAIKRLVDAGHITREEKPGVGVTYWVHPVRDQGASSGEGARETRPSPDEASPSPGDGGGLASRGENLSKPNKPSAGARGATSRSKRPPAGPSGGPATAAKAKVGDQPVRIGEGDRERRVREAIFVRSQGAASRWLDRVEFKVGDLVQAGGPVGLTITCTFAVRDMVERLKPKVLADAAEVLGVEVRWVSLVTGKLS